MNALGYLFFSSAMLFLISLIFLLGKIRDLILLALVVLIFSGLLMLLILFTSGFNHLRNQIVYRRGVEAIQTTITDFFRIHNEEAHEHTKIKEQTRNFYLDK